MACGETPTETMVNHSLARPRSHLRPLATALPSTATLAMTRMMSCTSPSPARTPCLVRMARSGTRRTMLHSRAASKPSETSLSLVSKAHSLVYLVVTRMAWRKRSAIGRSLFIRWGSVFSVAKVHGKTELEAFRKAKACKHA